MQSRSMMGLSPTYRQVVERLLIKLGINLLSLSCHNKLPTKSDKLPIDV
jgi:hypothetical protein